MKMHAPNGKKRLARFAPAAFAMMAAMAPVSAWALDVPERAVEDSCPVAGFAASVPTPVAQPTKAEAILGGARSKLDELKAQQAAASAAATPVTNPLPQMAMLAPAAGPGSVAAVAPCTAMAFTRLPSFAPQPDMDRRSRASMWVTRLAAVSIIRQTPVQAGLALQPVDVSKPDVFGSVALAIGRTPLDSKWRRAQAAGLAIRGGPWGAVIGEARSLDHGAKIDLINSWVNRRTSFVDDSVRFRIADRWATASETLRAGRGDCEDYAIAKMKLLEAAGVARDDMFLVIAKDLVRRADHALLVVRNGNRLVVLDNNTDRIVDAAAVRDYRPVMSYSAGKAWLHGYAAQPVTPQPAPIRIAALSS